MREPIRAVVCLLLLAAAVQPGHAVETTSDYAVQLSAAVQISPPTLALSWPAECDNATQRYLVYRKLPGDTSWGKPRILAPSATRFADARITIGTAYEYQVARITPHYTAYGYLCAGIEVPVTEYRGKLLLVVDHTHADALSNELSRLEQDLVGDGWTVIRHDVNPGDTVRAVKEFIREQYRADPNNVKCVFLFGHVPVPYSGDIVPDGHTPDHRGAWPCDGFYGDMDGTWTDDQVDDTHASDPRNRNVPGDGKFDQSSFPAPLKLMVGRVDLYNLPGRLTWGGPPTFPSELELLRNYLNKDHKFRTGQFHLPRQGVLGDYFGVRSGEAFAASGWRNLSAFFGPTNITCLSKEGTWIPTLSTNAWLCAYGCGAGTFTSMGGLGNANWYHDGLTTDLVNDDVKAVFGMLFGSWLGDWDSEDDLLRSFLALPSYGLASMWSGRPHWFLQHMALGAPIGFSTRLTQNNGPDGLYKTEVNTAAGGTHIALMGDPSLCLYAVPPPARLLVATNDLGVKLSWTASPDPLVAGYYLYRASNPEGPFQRFTAGLLTNTDLEVPPAAIASTYMVRAVKLETSASGSYFNASEGTFGIALSRPGEIAQLVGKPKADTRASKELRNAKAEPKPAT